MFGRVSDLLRAGWAESFDHVVDGVCGEALREIYFRDWDVFQTVSPMAMLAVEVDVHVGHGAVVVAFADFVFQGAASIFNCVDE